jgi:hypothetical protein
MKARAQSIFGNAQVYERAARLLNNAGTNDHAMLLPSSVNAALSLELYFKSLYILDHGADFKVNGKHSHHFAILFEELNEPTKQKLLDKFNTALSTRNNNDILTYQSSFNMVVPKDLKTNLVQWANVFVDLRYAHEFTEKNKGKQKTMMFFPEIRDSIYNTIIDREPAWKS